MTFVNAQRAAEPRADAIPLRVRRLQPPRRRTARASIAARSTSRNWPQIYPLGFLPVIEPTVVDASGDGRRARRRRDKWSYDVSGEYGHNSFAFTIGDTLNVSLGPTLPPTRRTFDAGTLVLNQFVAQRRRQPARSRSEAFAGPAQRRVRRGVSAARTTRSRAGEPDSYRDGGVPNQIRRPCRHRRAGVSRLPSVERGQRVAPQRRRLRRRRRRRRSRWLRLGVAGRAEHYSDFGGTVDGKLTARVQSDPRVSSCADRSSTRLPRAVARAVVLLVDRDELPESRPGARAGGVADAARRLGAGAGARRRAAQARELAARRAPASSSRRCPRARRDRRLLPHRHRRPDRAVGQLHRAADRGAARAVRRQQRAVLHQRDRHAHQRRRRDGELPHRARRRPATCACAPATTTRRTKIVGIGRDAAAARRLRVGAVRSHRAAAHRVRRSRATACGSAATGGGSRFGVERQRRPLRRVLQLHAQPGRRPGVSRRSG